ncbi:MAG: rhombosortase [Shewanellaceae bacterium]|nr:rhombosortase [Shewanellaceae bacterium]
MSRFSYEDPRRGWLLFLAIGGICYLLTYYYPLPQYQYNRYIVGQGVQLYRLITAHFMHTGEFHLVLNIIMLWFIGLLHSRHYKLWQWCLMIPMLMIGVSAGIHYLDPNTVYYIGLSGILHGLVVIGAIADLHCQQRSGYVLLLLVVIKVAMDEFGPNFPGLQMLIQADIPANANLFGALTGLILGLIFPFTLPRPEKIKRLK